MPGTILGLANAVESIKCRLIPQDCRAQAFSWLSREKVRLRRVSALTQTPQQPPQPPRWENALQMGDNIGLRGKHAAPFAFPFLWKNILYLLIQSFHPRTPLFFCYTSRRRTYVTNAIAIFRRCLSFSFTEPAAKLPFTWQLLMKSERFCKLVLGCFHFPINCPPAIIRSKLVIVSLFPFSL